MPREIDSLSELLTLIGSWEAHTVYVYVFPDGGNQFSSPISVSGRLGGERIIPAPIGPAVEFSLSESIDDAPSVVRFLLRPDEFVSAEVEEHAGSGIAACRIQLAGGLVLQLNVNVSVTR
jgi:hypothetical protein